MYTPTLRPEPWHGHPLALIGTGGFGRETARLVEQVYRALGHNQVPPGCLCFFEPDAGHLPRQVLGYPVYRQSDYRTEDFFLVAAIGDPQVRARVVAEYPKDARYAVLIHPMALVSEEVEIGGGSIIGPGCVVNTGCRLAGHVQLNPLCNIGHDTLLGEHFSAAPGVMVSGNVRTGARVYMGTAAATRQGIELGDDVFMGMGAMATTSLTQPGVYVGCPARFLRPL